MSPRGRPRSDPRPCSTAGCEGRAYAGGICRRCYDAGRKRSGAPSPTVSACLSAPDAALLTRAAGLLGRPVSACIREAVRRWLLRLPQDVRTKLLDDDSA